MFDLIVINIGCLSCACGTEKKNENDGYSHHRPPLARTRGHFAAKREHFFRSVHNRIECNQRKHTAGFSFLDAVGVVATQITGSAGAGVVDLFHIERTALPDDFGGEIDLVVGWANAWTELHDHVRGIAAEAFIHLSDRVCDNAKLGAFAAGMNDANRRCCWIDDVNCATVGDVNAERDAALIRNKAVAAWEFAVHRAAATPINDYYFVSVNLLSGGQRPIPDSDCVTNFAMRGIEPL